MPRLDADADASRCQSIYELGERSWTARRYELTECPERQPSRIGNPDSPALPQHVQLIGRWTSTMPPRSGRPISIENVREDTWRGNERHCPSGCSASWSCVVA